VPDRITITDLLVRGIIGVNDEERETRQDILVNLVLKVDARTPGRSDDIADAVNYRTIAKQVIALVESGSYFLVERLAEEIARLCLDHAGVQCVTVRVEKPGAVRFARSVGIEITRGREEP
jgi:D-erythro-7,8-dihydroneopterin triphosphate epimerase